MHKHVELACDVAVIGGGPGGLSAAIAAARAGAAVILVEKSYALGGAATSGLGILGYLDRRGKVALGGLAVEYIERLQAVGGTAGSDRCPVHNSITGISPDQFKIIADEMCREAGVRVILGCELTDVRLHQGAIEQVRVYGKCTDIDIRAKVFLDGTGDGDLAYLAGVPYQAGQDGTHINQPATLVFTIAGHDLEAFFDWVERHPEAVGIKESYAAGYDLAFFRETRSHCLIGLDRLIEKARASGDFDVPRNQFIYIKTASEHLLAINTVRILNIDASDPLALSDGMREGYRQVGVLMRFMRKYIPGFENVVLSQISPTLGVRETRHFEARRKLTADEMFAYQIDDETVALCGYNVDIHSGTASHIDLHLLEKPFGLPYGCMVPRHIRNLLLTGRTICVDSTVFAAARVMGPLMALGEAAGEAAAMCASAGCDVSDVDVAALRAALLMRGAVLDNA